MNFDRYGRAFGVRVFGALTLLVSAVVFRVAGDRTVFDTDSPAPMTAPASPGRSSSPPPPGRPSNPPPTTAPARPEPLPPAGAREKADEQEPMPPKKADD